MTEQNRKNNKDLQGQSPEKRFGGELDAAGKSLSEAMRISFIILKIIMFVLVGLFLLSGFETVGSDEQALVLRFGKIRGEGEERLLGPGLHWVFPYPIDEIVKIPVAKMVNLEIDSFWYFQTREEKLSGDATKRTYVPKNLNPIKDGYCITRSEKQNRAIAGSGGSDYNIVHSKWQLTYRIGDAELFFRNIYIEDVKPGEIYFDVITKSITPLLETLVEDAVVTAMVNYTIDEVLFEGVGKVAEHVKRLLQERFNKIRSGIKVESVQLTDPKWPRQVQGAFDAYHAASNRYAQLVSEAATYFETTLNEAGGSEELLAALKDESVSEEEKQLLWSELAGAAGAKIAQARAYRTEVVESARANAEYLQRILPEYRRRPKLVLQGIYQDAIKYVLNNADEKFIIQPAEGAKREIRIILSRDPMIKRNLKK